MKAFNSHIKARNRPFLPLFATLLLSLGIHSLGWAQFTSVNPAPLPVQFSDYHLFKNGQVYAIYEGANFLFKIPSVNDPSQGKVEIIVLPSSLDPEQIECIDPQHCRIYDGQSTLITNDGGYTWKIKAGKYFMDGIDQVTDQFWVGFGKYDFAYTTNAGASVNSFYITFRDRYLGYHNGRAYYLDQLDRIWSLNDQGTFHKEVDLDTVLPPLVDVEKGLRTAKGFLMHTDEDKIEYINNQYRHISTFAQLPSRSHPRFNRFGDTLLIINDNHLYLSDDFGRSWQLDSFSKPKQNFSFGGQLFLRKHKLYANINNYPGYFRYFDLKTKTFGSSSGNAWKPFSPHTFTYGVAQEPHFFSSITDSSIHIHLNEQGTIIKKERPPLDYGQYAFANAQRIAGWGYLPDTNLKYLAFTDNGGQSWQRHSIDSLSGYPSWGKNIYYAQGADCFQLVNNYRDTINFYNAHTLKLKSKLPITYNLIDVHFKNCDTGTVVLADKVLYTTNGGKTFQNVFQLNIKNDAIKRLVQIDTGGYALQTHSTIMSASQIQGPYDTLVHNHFARNVFLTRGLKLLSFSTHNDTLLYSSDLGQSYTKAFIISDDFYDVLQTNDSTILILTYKGFLKRLVAQDTLNIAFPADTLGGVVSLTKHQSAEEIAFFPNPVQAVLKIEMPVRQTFTVSVYSLKGEKVMQRKALRQKKLHLNLAHLPGGMYVVKVRNKTREVSHKVLKMN